MAKAAAKASAKKMGAPSTFTAAWGLKICKLVADGESLRSICARKDFPARETVRRWLADPLNKDFQGQYACAREDQADAFADEIVRIADETPDTEPVYNREGEIIEIRLSASYVAWQKTRIDARKWTASKLKPKSYGDRITSELTGPNGGPIETVELTPHEAAQKSAFLLAKGLKASKRKA